MKRHILTAHEFIAQGTSAGAIMSIAAANQALRGEIEQIALEVAHRTGQSLQIPGAVTAAREASRRRPANDNARRAPRRERRAA